MINPLSSTTLPAASLGARVARLALAGVPLISGAAVSFPAALAWFMVRVPGCHGTPVPVSICRTERSAPAHSTEERP